MRPPHLLLLLVPMLLMLGCGGVTIDLEQPKPAVAPEPEPEPEPQVEIDIHVLAFTAKWCGNCQRDKPQIEELRRRGVKVTVINADENPELVEKHEIGSLPTYIVYEDDVEIQRTGSITLVVTIIAKILKIVIPILLPLLL